MVLGYHGAQPFVAHRGVRHACGVGRVALAGAPGVEQAGAGGKSGWHIYNVLAGACQQLRDATAQPGGAFDGEASLRPASCPTGQRLVCPSVDGDASGG